MFFVDHYQAEILKCNISLREAVGADHDVHVSSGQLLDDCRLLLAGTEATERCDRNRELRHPALEGSMVLGGEEGGRYQHRNLKPRIDRLEGGPDGEFCLAKADIAAEQTIHRPRLAHVPFDGRQRRELVWRFLVRERGIEFLLPMAIFGKTDPLAGFAGGLNDEHLARHIGDRCLGRFFLAQPPLAPDAGQAGPRFGAADIFLNQADPRSGHVDFGAGGEFQL